MNSVKEVKNIFGGTHNNWKITIDVSHYLILGF